MLYIHQLSIKAEQQKYNSINELMIPESDFYFATYVQESYKINQFMMRLSTTFDKILWDSAALKEFRA